MNKQMKVTEKAIGQNMYYIRPFGAFEAAAVGTDLAKLAGPLLSGISPMFGGSGDVDIMGSDVGAAADALGAALATLDSKEFVRLMKELLTDSKNITVECEETNNQAKVLTYELANEIFCTDLQDMLVLCVEVIKVNYNGFFSKLGDQFGSLGEIMEKLTAK